MTQGQVECRQMLEQPNAGAGKCWRLLVDARGKCEAPGDHSVEGHCGGDPLGVWEQVGTPYDKICMP